MALKIPLIQGGGISFDLVPAVKRIVSAAGVAVDWDEHSAGADAINRGMDPLPAAMLDSVKKTGIALKTNLLPSPKNPRHNFNIELRHKLGVYASVRPLKNIRGLKARFSDVDCYVIRELTEDLYASIEHEIVPGVVQSIKVVTETASRRFFRFAFEFAKSRGRKVVHCVHKANILKLADGLFLEAFRSVAKDFPDVQAKEIIVDNCCMQMVSKPTQFDVLAMGNLYGDIVSDLGAGLVGGISATAGINIGDGLRIYECFHGGNPEDFGADRANPLPLLLPMIDLLDDVGEKSAADRMLAAMERVLTEAKTLPRDLGGTASTAQVADAIIRALA
jgi:isocitrate dehydrogenase (NAD+)